MELEQLSEEQAQLWARVDALWKLSLTRDAALVRHALHPSYTGWVTGQPEPHDREAAVASVGPSSPRVVSYGLTPLRITRERRARRTAMIEPGPLPADAGRGNVARSLPAAGWLR